MKKIIVYSGIISETEIIDREEYIKCIPKYLSSFTIVSFNKSKILDKPPNLFHKLLKILKIIIIIIIAFIFLFICFCICMSSKN